MRPAWFAGNDALHRPNNDLRRPAGFGNGDGAPEARRPPDLRHILHSFQDEPVAFFVVDVAGPTFGMDARLAAQGIDLDAGVVGQAGQPGEVSIALGLEARVVLEASTCFLDVLSDAEFLEGSRLEWQAGQKRAIFFQLVPVLSGDEQRTHTALYLHIPFCRTKCSYCDFNTYAGIEPLIPRYVDALCAEMRRYPAGLPVPTVNFGGGTPSLLSPDQLGVVIDVSRTWFDVAADAEISIEANPGGLDGAYFAGIHAAGVNRLSFGVQSLDAGELTLLTRRHSASEARQAVAAARHAGFDNISLDFMYGLPGQTLELWAETLDGALDLRPEHLSLYGLTVYDHLPLGKQVRSGALPAQDDDLMADMYELACDCLARAGYEQYEISNWALDPRFRCRHNLIYWRNSGWIGLGAGAHSSFGGSRYVNELKPAVYANSVLGGSSAIAETEPISADLARAETAMLGLRLNEGMTLEDDELVRLADPFAAGLLTLEGSHACLTPKGRLLSNEVFWRLLP
jgi:oxygen-independent coproporphyrinogen III oxidase